MSRTLFLGDSHSAGFYENSDGTSCTIWDSENNYAEIYSKLYDVPSAVYAMPGACNRHYPVWFSFLVDEYETNTAFIQSTYWNRDLLAANKNLDIADGMKSDHFCTPGRSKFPVPEYRDSKLIERWTDELVSDDYIENCVRTAPNSKHLEYKGFTFEELDCGMENILNMPYAYVKLWHEHITHLQYREFCSNLFIIDTLCKNYGVKWHLWTINDRVVMPKDLNFYGPLENCIRAEVSAETFIKDKHKLNIEQMVLDGEHYNYNVHKIIANEFIPYIKNLTKPK